MYHSFGKTICVGVQIAMSFLVLGPITLGSYIYRVKESFSNLLTIYCDFQVKNFKSSTSK